jgi:DNA-binding NarL/FixJ family response regulator
MFHDKGYISQAHRVGAWGYVLKEEAPERLVKAIERVAAGDRYFSQEMGEGADVRIDERLTEREREVLQLIAEGKRNNEIAEVMMRSLHTVRNHRARLMRKLGAHSVAALVKEAEEMGLVRLAPLKESDDHT